MVESFETYEGANDDSDLEKEDGEKLLALSEDQHSLILINRSWARGIAFLGLKKWMPSGALLTNESQSTADCALVAAAMNYDSEKGAAFRTHAWSRIRSYVQKDRDTMMGLIHIPDHLCGSLRKFLRLRLSDEQKEGSHIAFEEACTKQGISCEEERYALFRALHAETASPYSSENIPIDPDEISEDEELFPLPESRMEEEDLLKILGEAFDLLSEKEKIILSMRYGVFAYREEGAQTLEEIADKLGLSKQGVKFLQTKAIKALRGFFARRTTGMNLPKKVAHQQKRSTVERKSSKKFTDDQRKMIRDSHGAYQGNADAAGAVLGFASSSIIRYWKMEGLPIRKRGFGNALSPEELLAVLKLHAECKGNLRKAAERFKRHEGTVRKYWKQAGLEPEGRESRKFLP